MWIERQCRLSWLAEVTGASVQSAGLLGGKDHAGGTQLIARAAAILRVLARQPDGLSLGQIANAGLAQSTVQRIVAAPATENFVTTAGPRQGPPDASGARLVRQADRHFHSGPIIALLPAAEIIARLLQCRERVKDCGTERRPGQPMWCARATTDLVGNATIACNIARTALVDHTSSPFDWRRSRDRLRWIASRSISGYACSMEGTSC
jgi:IclR helix-turn-helix domain